MMDATSKTMLDVTSAKVVDDGSNLILTSELQPSYLCSICCLSILPGGVVLGRKRWLRKRYRETGGKRWCSFFLQKEPVTSLCHVQLRSKKRPANGMELLITSHN